MIELKMPWIVKNTVASPFSFLFIRPHISDFKSFDISFKLLPVQIVVPILSFTCPKINFLLLGPQNSLHIVYKVTSFNSWLICNIYIQHRLPSNIHCLEETKPYRFSARKIYYPTRLRTLRKVIPRNAETVF